MSLANTKSIFEPVASKKLKWGDRNYHLEKMQKINAQGRDIGSIPQIQNPKRRKKAKRSLKLFLETYFPNAFTLAWSADHLKVIKKTQYTIRHGGLFAMAMPRGSGKTTITERSILYAVLYGFRKFIVPIATNLEASKEILASIVTELENNELLQADFPEACYPIQKLEGISLRSKGQLCMGKPTAIDCKAELLVFASIAGAKCSGSRIKPVGITGRLRGMKATLDTGTVIRPDYVILDDPQDDESACSVSQCDKREDLIAGAVLGLAGNKTKISGIMPCTIIQHNDLADRMLNRKKHPDWKGECLKLLYKFPDAMNTLWQQYKDIREKDMQNDGNGEVATEFYKKNREEMDKGSIVAWKERKIQGEVSALQHCMNLLFDRGEYAFFSEYQNDPIVKKSSIYDLTREVVEKTCNGTERYELPEGTHFLTTFLDINLVGLHYTVVAFRTDYTAHIVDYGKYPEDENRVLWTAKDTRGLSEAQAIFKGIKDFCKILSEKPYTLDGEDYMIDGILVDGNYMTDTVYRAVASLRKEKFIIPVLPDRGRSVKHYSMPSKSKRVGLIGDNFHKEKAIRGMQVVHCSDYWRMTAQKALFLPSDAPGSLSIYGEAIEHKKLINHIISEKLLQYIPGEGKRDMYEWMLTPGMHNDLLDAIVGAYVGAGLLGANFNAQERRWKTSNKVRVEMLKERKKEESKNKRYWVSYD